MTSRYLRILPSILQWVCVVTGTYESRSITILHPILHSTPMNQHVREAAKICRHCENSWCIETIVWWKPASIDWILFILGHGNWWWKYWIDRYSDNLMRCNIEEFSHAWIPLDEKRTWSPNKDICGLERVWIEFEKRDRESFDQDVIDLVLSARLEVESYAHWLVTVMNMSLILEYETSASLWDVVTR